MKLFIVAVVCLTAAVAVPVEVIEDDDGQAYYMVPIGRQKRQTSVNATEQGVKLEHAETIFNTDNHRLDGSAYAVKNFASHGIQPDQYGGRLDYHNKPLSSTVFAEADHTRHFGTDVNAGVKYHIVNKKDFNVDITGQYGRHFGGLQGTGKPQAGVFLNFVKRF